MIPFKKEKGILATAVAIAGSALAGPSGVASACDLQNHCYAYARTQGLIVDGVAARYNVTNVGVPDINQGGFVAQALWAGVNNETASAWIEVGWIKGYDAGHNYAHYAVWGHADTGELHFDTIDNIPVGGAGTSHHYQLVRVNDGLYRAYIDNQEAYNFFGLPYTLWGEVGLEYTSDDSQAEIDEPRQLQWRNAGDLTWHSWGEAGSVGGFEIGSRSRWQWVSYPTHGRDWIQ